MAVYGDTHQVKLSFIFFSVLIAANLVLITYILASGSKQSTGDTTAGTPSSAISYLFDMHSVDTKLKTVADMPQKGASQAAHFASTSFTHTAHFFGDTAHDSIAFVGHMTDGGWHAVTHTTDTVTKFAADATTINYYIKPASDSQIPTITPLPAVKVASIAPAVTPAVAPQIKEASFVYAPVGTIIPYPQTIDAYAWGNCTRWAATRRAEIGDPIPTSWGNAATWAIRAARDGYLVDRHPTQGSIMQTPYSAGGLGHVAFVESVDPDGTWHISEMNAVGLDKVDYRALPASAAAYYSFIH